MKKKGIKMDKIVRKNFLKFRESLAETLDIFEDSESF